MGFKFGKCKMLTTLQEQALANTSPDFIDFEGCDELTTLSGTNGNNKYGALYNTKAVTVSFKDCAKLTTIGQHMLHMASGVVSNLESIDFTGCIGLKTIGKYFLSQSDSIHSDSIVKIDLSPCINLESIDDWFACYSANLEEVDMHGLSKLNNTGTMDVTDHTLFDSCSKLTKVDITGCTALEKISTGAFRGTKIETLIGWDTEKSHIKEIGPLAFLSASLVNIDISNMPELIKFYTQAFKDCASMKTCPNNCPKLQSIDSQAFYNCTNLGLNDDGTHSTLDLHNNTNLTTIGESAFEGVKAIETINLDNDASLASLGNSCFKNNTALKHFYARNCTSLTSIGSSMLSESTQLLDVRFGGCTSLSTIGNEAFYSCKAMLYCELPEDTVVSIGSSCFKYAGLNGVPTSTMYDQWKANITNAQIAAGLINTGDEYLKSTFKSNVCRLLDKNSFEESRIFEEIDCDNSPIAYGDEYPKAMFNESYVHKLHFKNCGALKYIPEKFASSCPILEVAEFDNSYLMYILAEAFNLDASLRSFTCDFTNLMALRSKCFNNTTCVDGVPLNWALTSCMGLEEYAFHYSTLIKSITVDGGEASSIGASFAAFAPNLETVSITNMHSMTSIGNEAFIQCPKLQSADFSGCDALTTIGSKAFQIDDQMTECKIQDSPLTTLNDLCFHLCTRLENFDADSSNITTIGKQAFEYCTSFKTFKIHQDDTQAVTYGNSAFAGWRNAASGITPPTYPLDVYIYGSTPASIPTHSGTESTRDNYGFINGINNNGCAVSIHFNQDAKDLYKAAAKLVEDNAHAKTDAHAQFGKDAVWYWCCSNGQITATEGGSSTPQVAGNFQCVGWYATSVATTPTIVFDL